MTIGRKAPAEMDRAKAQRGMIDKTTPLYVVCSPYRCVGKTLISRLLTEFYVLNDRPVAAYDLADEGPQLTDYLPQFTTVADIGDIFGQMAFFERLIADNEGANIIDLSHRMFQNFFTVVEQIEFFEEARRRSIEPLILFITDPDPKSPKAQRRPISPTHWMTNCGTGSNGSGSCTSCSPEPRGLACLSILAIRGLLSLCHRSADGGFGNRPADRSRRRQDG